MCGLAGFWHKDGHTADPDIVASMLDRQQYRGPDDRGIWTDGSVALGLDRLSILDLSDHGRQPFQAPENSSVIAYNGEIYNWRELRRELRREGIAFTSECDTEVVLHALDRWGPEIAIPRFNGMFALAWFDRTTGTLWLARDRSGIKPLYLTQSGSLLAFASEAKALFAHPAVTRRPDVHALVTQVYLERLAGDWTGFEGVRSILPGTMVRVSDSGKETITWFDVERDVDVDRILASSREPFSEHVNEFRNRIENSVELHLRSDAPLAVMCSGGLDSSLTTAIAKRYKPDLVAFVADVEGAPVAEAEKAQQVADHLGVGLRRIRITEDDYPSLWCRAAYHNDDAIYFYQNPLTLRVSEAVRDEGFKVLVTGEGADELFGGYPWQQSAKKMWNLRKWHSRFIPNIAPFRKLFRLVQALAPSDLEALSNEPFARRSEWRLAPPSAGLVIDSDIRRRIASALFRKLDAIPDLGDRAFLAREFSDFYHHLRVLLTSNDKMTMATSVEMRVPFLENGLIDFGLHLAARSKLLGEQGKRVVKASAEGLLPRDIIHATKVGFAMPENFWSGYENVVNDGLLADLFKWGSSEQESVQQILLSNPLTAHKIVSMELWAQIHFNGRSPEQMEEKLRAARRHVE